jgi:PEP-CTERM motif.
MTFRHALTLAAMAVFTLPAHASLVGTSVTGSLQFNGSGPNYFNPTNGFVPTGNGYLNASDQFNSPTVTISGSAVEFGFFDGANRDTADFSDIGLTITDISGASGGSSSTYTFVDNAFVGLSVTKLTDTYATPVSFSLVGNTLTVSASAFSGPVTNTATFSLASSVPEPQSAGLIAAGLALFAYAARRRPARKQ